MEIVLQLMNCTVSNLNIATFPFCSELYWFRKIYYSEKLELDEKKKKPRT